MATVQAAQLLARGVQDAWLSGNPQVSFYRSSFKRHVPFASTIERFLVPIDGKIVLNPKSDLIGYTYLTAHNRTTGTLVPNVVWTNIISSVELVIGNQTIATHDLTYINTLQKVLEAETYSKRSTTPAFQPLGFFFDRQPLPIAALRYTDVRINITWASTTAATQYLYRCWSHCVHLGEDERRFFATQRHQMLIPQIQRLPISTEPFFRGPLKYIAAPCTNYTGIYNPIPLNISLFTGIYSNKGIVENNSNVYLQSVFRGQDASIYNTDGTLFGIILKTNAFDDVIVVKSNKVTGKVVWATKITGTGYDDAYELKTDAYENIYITGATSSNPMNFYSTDGSSVSLASAAAFLVKYDMNGVVQWVTRTVGGDARSLEVEGSNVYITGYFDTTSITAYDSPGTTSSIPSINRVTTNDGYFVKYNSNGQAQWITTISGNAERDYPHVVKTDSSGIYYTGQYSGPTVIIYNASGVASSLPNISVPSGKRTRILVKYSYSGIAIWSSRCVGDIPNFAVQLKTNLNIYDDAIFWAPKFTAGGTISLYDSQNNLVSSVINTDSNVYMCLIRSDTSGNIVWSTKCTGWRAINNLYNNNSILISSQGSQGTFYSVNGDIKNIYGDELSGDSIFIGRYDFNGNLINTRKITGGCILNGADYENYTSIRPNNRLIRVYDTSNDSHYKTLYDPTSSPYIQVPQTI